MGGKMHQARISGSTNKRAKKVRLAVLIAVGALVAACSSLDTAGGSSVSDTSSSTTRATVPVSSSAERTEQTSTSTTTQGRAREQQVPAQSEDAEEVFFEGATYECDPGKAAQWLCGAGTSTIYCEGVLEPVECSAFWYPSSLSGIRLVTFEGFDFACELYGTRCISYTGGPPPTLFTFPEVWCDASVCSYYDPDVWFEITFDFSDYICTEATFGFSHFDCYSTLGTPEPPVTALWPDIYCSGPEHSLECSENWYPDEMGQYELVSFSGVDYLCEQAWSGGLYDYDCGSYSGGDPSLVYTGDLKCTDRGYSFECDWEYYPSELDGLWVGYIGMNEYVCQDSYGGSECFLYYGGSPSAALGGWPDLYCNFSGYCDEAGYP